MTLHPCSDPEHGPFISMDGPGGAGIDAFTVDCNLRPPEQVAAQIRDQLMASFTSHRQTSLS